MIAWLEDNALIVSLGGQALIIAWLAFIIYAVSRRRAASIVWALVLGLVLGMPWWQADPLLRRTDIHGFLVPLFLAAPIIALAATMLADAVTRARSKSALTWAGVIVTLLVVGALAGWAFRPRTIWTAINCREPARVQALLARSPELVNARDAWGNAPLHRAAYLGGYEIVAILASHGADLNARDGGGHTPLTLAVRHDFAGCPETVRVLLEAGADPNWPESNGLTPLSLSEESGATYSRITTACSSSTAPGGLRRRPSETGGRPRWQACHGWLAQPCHPSFRLLKRHGRASRPWHTG